MKKLISFAAFTMIVAQINSQVIIQGKLKDNKGRPLPGASIALKDTYDGTVADSLSNYKFTTTEKGEQTIIATNIGYRSYEQKMTIGATEVVIDIALKE